MTSATSSPGARQCAAGDAAVVLSLISSRNSRRGGFCKGKRTNLRASARAYRVPDFYGRPRSPDPLLFDLCRDPAETRDLSRERPDVLHGMLAQLAAWRAEMAAATGEPDPIREQGLSLGYDQFMERLLARR